MEDQKFSFSESFQKTKEYVETQFDLLKLKAIARSSRIAGALILDATQLLLLMIVIFFLSLAFGFFLGEVLNSNALGFLITGLIFLVLFFIIRSISPKLEARCMDLIISRILSKWNEEVEEADIEKVAGIKKNKESESESFNESSIK